MNIKKITQLSVKLGKTKKDKDPKFFYDMVTKDKYLSSFFNNLTGEEIIFFTFMASAVSYGLPLKELDNLFEQIKKNIFIFSLAYVDDINPSESCPDCGGDGEVNCDWCGGSNEIECEDCGGDGETEDDEGDFTKCDVCDGSGSLDCNECNQGYVACDTCSGNGEVEKYGYIELFVEEYVSFDMNIFNFLEIKEDESEIDTDKFLEMVKDTSTYIYSMYEVETNNFPKNVEENDRFFLNLEKFPKFTIGIRQLDSNLPYNF